MVVGILITAIVILFCVVLNRLSDRMGVPMLLAFIVLGMVFGSDGLVKIPFENYAFAEQICSVALIFIMFYGGFGTNWKQARPVASKAALLSTIGVLLTALLTGGFCHYILHWNLLESMLLGAVISSTDAASVFSILRSKKMGLKEHTDSLLELESGSNDPCSYMLTILVLAFLQGGIQGGEVLRMVVFQFFFGILIGVGVALMAAAVLRKVSFVSGLDMAFVIGVALLAYAWASLCGGNGYLSVYLCGILLGNTKIRNKKSLVHFFDGVTRLMQMLIFFLLGLLSTPSRLPGIILPALAIMLFLTFVARPVSVFVLLSPFRCRMRQQLLVAFAGLRGAASIVFAIMAVVSGVSLSQDLYHIVFCMVLLSIAFQGGWLSACAKWLKMTDDQADVMKTFSDYSEEMDLQFVRIRISHGHAWSGKAIRDLTLPPDMLLVMILRKNENILPEGNTVLEEGDIAVLGAYPFEGGPAISLKEQTILAGSEWIGQSIATFSPQPDELVILILRGEAAIIPNGNTLIAENDILVIRSQE